jgi:hypothetical protein
MDGVFEPSVFHQVATIDNLKTFEVLRIQYTK